MSPPGRPKGEYRNAEHEGASVKPAAAVVLEGRKVVGGIAEGEALVTRDRVSGWGGVDPRTGTVIEMRHELRGQSFAGRVLVFPGAKGSSGWSAIFHSARMHGKAPAAMLFNEMTSKIALGAVVTHAPAMTDFDHDPLDAIQTGDWVRVDADRGIVEVTRRGDRLPPIPIP